MPSTSAGDLSWQPLAQLLVSWLAGCLGDPHSSKRWALEKRAEHQNPLQGHPEPGLCLSTTEPAWLVLLF